MDLNELKHSHACEFKSEADHGWIWLHTSNSLSHLRHLIAAGIAFEEAMKLG
jgi:hypothetical protein